MSTGAGTANGRRQFAVALVMSATAHLLVIGAIIVGERIMLSTKQKPQSIVFIPAAPRGELPAGPAIGIGEAPRGNNPRPAPAKPAPVAVSPTAPVQTTRSAPAAQNRPPSIARNPSSTTARPASNVQTSTPTAQRSRQATQTQTAQATPRTNPSQLAASGSSSLSEIRQRLMQGMQMGGQAGIPDGAPGGTGVGARGTPAGGGTGRGQVGDPHGSEIGILGGSGPGTPFWDYYVHIHDVLYAAWEQPSEFADPLRPPTARVRLRIARDGSLWASELVKPSGIKQVDESALSAVRSARLNPPPQGLLKGKDFLEITVAFKLGGES